jgi:hypothetical protein
MPLFRPPDVSRLQKEDDLKGLIKALKYQKNYNIRKQAASALGLQHDYSAAEPLFAAVINDKSPSVRLSAIEALDHLGYWQETATPYGHILDALMENYIDLTWGVTEFAFSRSQDRSRWNAIKGSASQVINCLLTIEKTGDPHGVPFLVVAMNRYESRFDIIREGRSHEGDWLRHTDVGMYLINAVRKLSGKKTGTSSSDWFGWCIDFLQENGEDVNAWLAMFERASKCYTQKEKSSWKFSA